MSLNTLAGVVGVQDPSFCLKKMMSLGTFLAAPGHRRYIPGRELPAPHSTPICHGGPMLTPSFQSGRREPESGAPFPNIPIEILFDSTGCAQ